MTEFRLETERLILREWRDGDKVAFHAINTDPRVMKFLGPAMTMQDIDALVARLRGLQETLGHCFWAVERKDDGRLIGWCGLIRGGKNTPIEDRVEVGWRLPSTPGDRAMRAKRRRPRLTGPLRTCPMMMSGRLRSTTMKRAGA